MFSCHQFLTPNFRNPVAALYVAALSVTRNSFCSACIANLSLPWYTAFVLKSNALSHCVLVAPEAKIASINLIKRYNLSRSHEIRPSAKYAPCGTLAKAIVRADLIIETLMTTSNAKAVEEQIIQGRVRQAKRRRSEAMKKHSSEGRSDKPHNKGYKAKLVRPVPRRWHGLQPQPFSSSLVQELDESVRRTLSQDWQRDRFSPRPRGVPKHRMLGDVRVPAPLFSPTALGSIAEEGRYEDCEFSADISPIAVRSGKHLGLTKSACAGRTVRSGKGNYSRA